MAGAAQKGSGSGEILTNVTLMTSPVDKLPFGKQDTWNIQESRLKGAVRKRKQEILTSTCHLVGLPAIRNLLL